MWVIKPGEEVFREMGALEAFDLIDCQDTKIALTGAGGKTSTLLSLARDYKKKGKQAVITTTTHMFHPSKEWIFSDQTDFIFLKEELGKSGVLWIGTPCGNGKIRIPSSGILERMDEFNCPVIYEADGARRLPFKVPGTAEPVLFAETKTVIGVLGLDALNGIINECCFRPEETAALLNKAEEDRLDVADYVKVIKSRIGLRKGVTDMMRYIVVLNKAEDTKRRKEALLIRELLKQENINNIYITSHRL